MEQVKVYHDLIDNDVDSRLIVFPFTVSTVIFEKTESATELELANLLQTQDWHSTRLAPPLVWTPHTD